MQQRKAVTRRLAESCLHQEQPSSEARKTPKKPVATSVDEEIGRGGGDIYERVCHFVGNTLQISRTDRGALQSAVIKSVGGVFAASPPVYSKLGLYMVANW